MSGPQVPKGTVRKTVGTENSTNEGVLGKHPGKPGTRTTMPNRA